MIFLSLEGNAGSERNEATGFERNPIADYQLTAGIDKDGRSYCM
jgi:hypothetical protein